MKDQEPPRAWQRPWESLRPDQTRNPPLTRLIRVAAWGVLAAAIVITAIQFQYVTVRNLCAGEQYDARLAAGKLKPGETPPKEHKGPIGRWRKAIRQFWAGQNIYLSPAPQSASTTPATAAPAPAAPPSETSTGEPEETGTAYLHPNMPFTVILLTPFAYMPVSGMAAVYNLLKIIVLAATVLLAVRVADHDGRRMGEPVVWVGLLWALLMIVSDLQHGNTNIFVLGAIVFHLWLYRRGKDLWAGFPLALAICLKMTPALFILYWLYQRNWKLLAGTVLALIVFAGAIPVAASMGVAGGAWAGLSHYTELTGTWVNNLVLPGTLKGAWYPIHQNQSLPGVIGRYFLTGPDGNYFWGPDDNPNYINVAQGWITLKALAPETVKMIVRIAQLAIVLLAAWAIGWRKLPRDDGRRGLHYAIVLLAMMILNQRTWDHHAAVLLMGYLAIWYAIGYGQVSRPVRMWTLVLTIAGGTLYFLTRAQMLSTFAKLAGMKKAAGPWADRMEAYGPSLYHFLLMFAVAIILAVALKKSDDPYAQVRQTLKAPG